MTEIATINEAGAAVVEAKDTATFETKSFDGIIENQWGRKLPEAVSFAATYEHLLVYEAIPAKEQPTQEDILKVVNDARKASKRQSAMQKALDDKAEVWKKANPDAKTPNPYVKPTMEDDPSLQLASMVKGMVASKRYNEEQATALAKQMLGIE